MEPTLVNVESISKKYCLNLKDSMMYGLCDIARSMINLPLRNDVLRRNEFWALKNISFNVKRGECIGLIGPNGAGKSTLLKILNGIITPDQGRIRLQGRVGGLLELGAGFHPLLTGRENIYVNGAILGMHKKELDKKLPHIIAFADIGKFIDSPVKYYSSGMLVRLGFAVAAQLEPEILLIDEILAVGDAGFRAKCYDAVYSLLKKSAVIFVSHDMTHINRMCNTVIVLNQGNQIHTSSPASAISAYFELLDRQNRYASIQYSNGKATIENLHVCGTKDEGSIAPRQPFEVSFELNIAPEISEFTVILSILSRDRSPVAFAKNNAITLENGRQLLRFVTPQLTLSPDKYSLSIAVYDSIRVSQILWYYDVMPFIVNGQSEYLLPVSLIGEWTITSPS